MEDFKKKKKRAVDVRLVDRLNASLKVFQR